MNRDNKEGADDLSIDFLLDKLANLFRTKYLKKYNNNINSQERRYKRPKNNRPTSLLSVVHKLFIKSYYE